MPRIYKIHPAIGFCRVGDASSYFVGPERVGHPGVEIAVNHSEIPISNYKAGGRIKRQGARFRVFEYEVDSNGTESFLREVPGTQVEWSVLLANTKAAGNELIRDYVARRHVLVPGGPPRNQAVYNRASLKICSSECTISGTNHTSIKLDQGRFLGHGVLLGEISTDNAGNLIILGGMGISNGIPKNSGDPIPPLKSFRDNDRWHDDVSDGPVNALVTSDDGSVVDAIPSWVICGPPDYAPEVQAPVTLYDIAIAAAIARGWWVAPATPSFMTDILPILRRSLSMRWVHDWYYWNDITDDWQALSDRSNLARRALAYRAITETSLREFSLPAHLLEILTKWHNGVYLDDYTPSTTATVEPKTYDRAALEACIATSFFPGIEAGFTIGEPSLYSETGRLSHQQVEPGQLTAQMALPWQADFNDCRDDWWPSQRPNDVFASASQIPNAPVDWQEGVGGSGNDKNRKDMVKNYWKLGFLVSDGQGNLIEAERHISLPPR